MKLSEGAKYEASLDAVAAGDASATQIAEAKAVVFGVTNYLNDISQRVGDLENLMSLLQKLADEGVIIADKITAAMVAIHGDQPADPAVTIQGADVVETK